MEDFVGCRYLAACDGVEGDITTSMRELSVSDKRRKSKAFGVPGGLAAEGGDSGEELTGLAALEIEAEAASQVRELFLGDGVGG